MTIDAVIPTRWDFTGNDVATSFSYTIKINNKTHLTLVHTDTSGVENALGDPLVVDVDYTVNGVGVDGGGTVDFPKAGSVYSTLATGEKLAIIPSFPVEQTTNLPNVGRVFNVSVEDQLDYLTILVNQLQEKLDRSVKFPLGSTLTDITYPEGTSAANRALKLAQWNATGTDLQAVAIASSANVDPIVTEGDIVQGDSGGDAERLAIGSTGQSLVVVAGKAAWGTPVNQIIRSIILRLVPGSTPGTEITASNVGTDGNNIYNPPSISTGTDLTAGGGAAGSFSLSANGKDLTMDITEEIVGILSSGFINHDINSSSTTEMYMAFLTIVSGNLVVQIRKRGVTSTAVDLRTILASGDTADLLLSFVTST